MEEAPAPRAVWAPGSKFSYRTCHPPLLPLWELLAAPRWARSDRGGAPGRRRRNQLPSGAEPALRSLPTPLAASPSSQWCLQPPRPGEYPRPALHGRPGGAIPCGGQWGRRLGISGGRRGSGRGWARVGWRGPGSAGWSCCSPSGRGWGSCGGRTGREAPGPGRAPPRRSPCRRRGARRDAARLEEIPGFLPHPPRPGFRVLGVVPLHPPPGSSLPAGTST